MEVYPEKMDGKLHTMRYVDRHIGMVWDGEKELIERRSAGRADNCGMQQRHFYVHRHLGMV